LDFEKSPPATTSPSPIQPLTDPVWACALRTEVQALLDKGAVVVAKDHSSPGFYSHIFLVPKKSRERWLIIDLSRLNRFLLVPRFKMETTRSVATAIRPKDLDLRDAYFHIPMHPDYQHFLRFCHEGRVYQFQALPFGLVSAPLIFTTGIKAFVAPFHALGLKLHFYLDDWLHRCQCCATLRRQVSLLLRRVR
jgi:hypothetical protein